MESFKIILWNLLINFLNELHTISAISYWITIYLKTNLGKFAVDTVNGFFLSLGYTSSTSKIFCFQFFKKKCEYSRNNRENLSEALRKIFLNCFRKKNKIWEMFNETQQKFSWWFNLIHFKYACNYKTRHKWCSSKISINILSFCIYSFLQKPSLIYFFPEKCLVHIFFFFFWSFHKLSANSCSFSKICGFLNICIVKSIVK